MDVVQQKLQIKEWPLKKAGDEKFFGYVVAMGIFPREWGDSDGMIQYADFAYNDRYERFSIPDDESLKRQLHAFLWDNINGQASPSDIYGKVWIKRTKEGYLVELP